MKTNRDYLRHRSAGSWLYMSRLAALKEFSFLKALHENGFCVPKPVAQNRHTLVMELVQALPLRQIKEVPDPAGLYAELIETILRLASFGLIHGDFNEFNILIKENRIESTDLGDTLTIKANPVLIDFPQMVSIDHVNAEFYFDRDVKCVKRFFQRRFHFVSDEPGPFFVDALKRAETNSQNRLDTQVEASGFSKKMAKELENYIGFEGATMEEYDAKDGDENHCESDCNESNGSDQTDGEHIFGSHHGDDHIVSDV